MTKKILITSILLLVLGLNLPQNAFALNEDPTIGTGPEVPEIGSLTCSGFWTKLICAIKTIADVIKDIRNLSSTLSNWLPHSFPFGGPILSSEQACSFKFTSYTSFPNPFYPCTPVLCPGNIVAGPIDVTWGLGGRAIEVGPPVPSGGKVIAFPWISKVYDNHTENRAGPWSLGLGFTPFPLDEINKSLENIIIWIPPNPFNPPCSTVLANWLLPPTSPQECIENLRFECLASGEKDQQGNDIYKVIRLLGTSKEDVPQDALNSLRSSFPTFPWP
jgi:hypothetical protein